MSAPGSLLEENLERVIDSVVRNVNAGRGAVPDIDAPELRPAANEEADTRATIADLCGHVAHALKSLDAVPNGHATYRAPVPLPPPPTLNLVR